MERNVALPLHWLSNDNTHMLQRYKKTATNGRRAQITAIEWVAAQQMGKQAGTLTGVHIWSVPSQDCAWTTTADTIFLRLRRTSTGSRATDVTLARYTLTNTALSRLQHSADNHINDRLPCTNTSTPLGFHFPQLYGKFPKELPRNIKDCWRNEILPTVHCSPQNLVRHFG